MHITLPETYTKRHKGSEDEPGIMRKQESLATDGFTIYLPKGHSNNIFHNSLVKSDLENLIRYTGELPIDSYPEYTENFRITQNKENGLYRVEGNVMNGIDKDGNPLFGPVQTDYYPDGTDLNWIMNNMNDWLTKEIYQPNKNIVDNYHQTHGIKDPKQLIQNP